MTAFSDAFALAGNRRLTRKEKYTLKAQKPQLKAKIQVSGPELPDDFLVQLLERAIERDLMLKEKRAKAQLDKELNLVPRIPRPGFYPRPILVTSRLCTASPTRKVQQAFAKSLNPKLVDIVKLGRLPEFVPSQFMPEPSTQPHPTPQARDEAAERLRVIDQSIAAITAAADAARLRTAAEAREVYTLRILKEALQCA